MNTIILGFKVWHILAFVLVLFVLYKLTQPSFSMERFTVSGPDAVVKIKTTYQDAPIYLMHSSIYCPNFTRGCSNLLFYTTDPIEASQFNVIANGDKIHLKDTTGTLGKCSQTLCPGYYCMTNVDENKIEFTVKTIENTSKFVLITPDNQYVGICGVPDQACNVLCLKASETEALQFEMEEVIVEPETSSTQSVFTQLASN